jgi:DNA-nicking Smr family endonuclease
MCQDDDLHLFKDAMNDVAQIDANKIEPYRKKRRPVPVEQPVEKEPEEGFADRNIQTHDELLFVRPGIQKRLFADLQRGKLPPEETLDLHGYRVEEARRIVRDFIRHAQLRRYRCVRIIHGKGKRSSEAQPVLKQKINQWLPQREEVLAFCSAPRWDGGTGASYVLIARPKTAL